LKLVYSYLPFLVYFYLPITFNALLLAFCGPAELLPAVVKHSSAVNRKLFVKTATKTDVALRATFVPHG
jgi:hypothetical protein